jgi:hypothetical protein
MRRTQAIRLTLLPLLASATMARAQSAQTSGPPGMTEPRLSPPGMTVPRGDLDEPPCVVDDDPRPECREHPGTVAGHSAIHVGGFGHYFGGRGGGHGG